MTGISATTTTTLLLRGLLDRENAAAWEEFHARYAPILYAVARRLGLSDADAADICQEALTCFIRDYREGKYQRERGRLRSWLSSLVRYRAIDWLRARARAPGVVGLSAAGQLSTADEIDAAWEAEQRQSILRQALDEIRQASRFDPRTLRAFERVALDDHPAAQVATELQLTIDDVYQAKSRVSQRLREIVARIEALYDDA